MRVVELQRLGDFGRHALDVYAEPATRHLALLLQLRQQLLGEVDGDRESDADVSARAN